LVCASAFNLFLALDTRPAAASALARDENDDGCAFEADERKPRGVQQIRHLHRSDAALANPTKTLVPNDGL
jgi:hypothetical protein